MFLLAYMPPSNIAQEIIKIKRGLFRTWGTPSAVALPPLVPLQIFNAEPKRIDIHETYQITGHRFTTGNYIISENSLFMSVDTGRNLPAGEHRFFPLYPGFHMLCNESNGPSLKKILSELETPPGLEWTAGEYSLLALHLDSHQKQWWNFFRFEEVYHLKARKGKKRKD